MRPCGICGAYDHPTYECFLAEDDGVEEAPVVRKPYVQSKEYREWLMEIDLRKDGGSIAA